MLSSDSERVVDPTPGPSGVGNADKDPKRVVIRVRSFYSRPQQNPVSSSSKSDDSDDNSASVRESVQEPRSSSVLAHDVDVGDGGDGGGAGEEEKDNAGVVSERPSGGDDVTVGAERDVGGHAGDNDRPGGSDDVDAVGEQSEVGGDGDNEGVAVGEEANVRVGDDNEGIPQEARQHAHH